MDLIGRNIGRYHIVEQVGEGGMAAVYKAFDTHLERDVAIKIIRKEVFSPITLERVIQRFEREGKALAKLSYPNIVHIYDYGVFDDSPYLVMEFVEAGTLKAKMGKPIPWKESIQLVIPIAKALSYAHQRGIIHRDVKPSNILLNCDGQPLLTDFGVAKLLEGEEGHTLTGTGVGIGTPEYMAPEQGLGAKDVDNRADIYSLGIVLYELLTGQKPYTADTPMAVVVMQARDPLPDPRQFVPDLPEAVERILFKSLAKNPDDRYKHAIEMIAALEELLKTAHVNESTTTSQTSINTPVEYLSSDAVYVSETPIPLDNPTSNKQSGSQSSMGTEDIQETQTTFDAVEDQHTPTTQVTFDELENAETSGTANNGEKESPDQPADQILTSATNSPYKRKFFSRKELWELAVVICVLIIVMGVISGIWLLVQKDTFDAVYRGALEYSTVTPSVVLDPRGNYYTFTNTAGTEISIVVTGSIGFDPVLSIYDSNNNLLAYDDDSGNGNSAFIHGFSLPSTGTYNILVHDYNNSTGAYQITLYGGDIAPQAENNTNSALNSYSSTNVTVNSSDGWVSLGMYISSGQFLSISYVSGSWSVCDLPSCGGSLEGNGSSTMGGGPQYSLNYNDNIIMGCYHGALIARIGDGEPFCVNNSYDATAYSSGELFLSVNDTMTSDDHGAITVAISNQ